MATEQTFESTINHRASAAIAAAVEHLRPRLMRVVDGAARASVQAAAPVIADAVRAAAPSLGTATRRLARTAVEALIEADRTDPLRRAQRDLEALYAAGEAARREVLERPSDGRAATCKRCAGTGPSAAL